MRDNNSANWQETAAVTGISSDLSRRIIMDELAQFAHVKMTWKSVDEAIDQFASAQPEISQIAVLLDLHSIMDISGQSINSLFDILLSHKASIAVLTDLENLDEVYGLLARGGAQFIVGEEAADIMLAMSLLTRGKKMGKVFDPHSDEDTESLSKISSELLEFARAISRIAQTEAGGEISAEHLADKPIGFRAQQSTSQSPFLPRGIGAETSLSAEKIRDLIRLRRMRDRFFKADLFADPAWDILLDLMAARLEGQRVSVSSLCIAAAVPATTALRWIKTMTDQGYLERKADPTDARRVYIALSEQVAGQLAEYLQLRFKASGRI